MTREIPLSQGKVALVDDADFDWLNQWKWSASRQGRPHSFPQWRAVRCVGPKKGPKHLILMHRLIMNAPTGATVDHINGDPLDNRRKNLRICPQGKQSLNRPGNRTGRKTSRFKGVYWQKDIGRWRARFRLAYLGTFINEMDAARAYDAAAKNFDPEFARLNLSAAGGVSSAA